MDRGEERSIVGRAKTLILNPDASLRNRLSGIRDGHPELSTSGYSG